MKYLKVQMIRENLESIPQYELPVGYKIRNFKIGEEVKWANLEMKVNEFDLTLNSDKICMKWNKDVCFLKILKVKS